MARLAAPGGGRLIPFGRDEAWILYLAAGVLIAAFIAFVLYDRWRS